MLKKGGLCFMKKYWIISLAAGMAVLFSGCGVGNVGGLPGGASSQASSAVSSQVSAGSYDDSLAGLEKYLTAAAQLSGTPTSMQADVIGAKQGDRYVYGNNGGKNNVTVELYEYDPSSLNAAAQKSMAEVKSSGKLTILGQKVDAVVSGSGKYLMIFKNSATGDADKAYDKQLVQLFTDFKK
jgi:hypothetical protein